MTDRGGEASANNAIPIVYQGRQFPSRQALADYLTPLVGKTKSTMRTLISRYDGDVERALAPRKRVHRPMTFEGQVFPHRKALAKYLAPRLQRPAKSVEGLLLAYHDDVAAVLAAKPYRPAAPRLKPIRRTELAARRRSAG